ncbi:MAG: NAD(P)H-dependent glycerol-3-phosphate dehydrogenase [Metamycoplasmataceae bacterium]
MNTKKILIIGSGALGTAFSNILFDAGQKNILIYGIDEKELQELQEGHNTKYFSKDSLIHKVNTTNNLEKAIANVSYIVLALPSIVIPEIIKKINKFLDNDAIIISGSKGFWPNSEKPLHTGMVDALKNNENVRGVVSILGPSYAEEMVNRSFTIVSAVSSSDDLCQEVQKLFSNNYFRVYRQTDVTGSEVGAIYKNILAIGAGILTQSGFKINTIAAFITRGIHEMSVFNDYLGGSISTIMGLTGLGDLILTSMSDLSRNRTFGKNFVLDRQKALSSNTTLEGLHALKIVEKIRKEKGINLPIVECLYQIIYNDKDITKSIPYLWDRELKAE